MRFEKFVIPELEERPAWWQVRPSEIMESCGKVKRGRLEIIAETPYGFPVYAVFYGDFSDAPQQANWSAGLASGRLETFGRQSESRSTLMLLAGIHGGEAESVAGMVNLISLYETGKDLRGKERPELMRLLADWRVIIVPCANMDGRSISADHLHGVDYETFRRASQGGWLDGTEIGWLGSKEYFPLPLDRVSFPGGYPNGDGFNIMHDACPGHVRTAEARGLLRLAEQYSVDVVLNCHSCETEPQLINPSAFGHPAYVDRAQRAVDAVNASLFAEGLRHAPVPPAATSRGIQSE